jgi:hypothetical protein
MHDPNGRRAPEQVDFDLGELDHLLSAGRAAAAGEAGSRPPASAPGGRQRGPLERVAERLDHVVPAGAAPVWVRLMQTEPTASGSDGDLELTRPEVDAHLPSLLGWRAPPGCVAVAVVADGLARPAETRRSSRLIEDRASPAAVTPASEKREREAPGDEATSVRIVCVVDRWQRVAGRLHVAGGPAVCDPPEGGRLLDSLLRAFGHPTSPPEAQPAALLGRMWLGQVLAVADDDRTLLSWPRIRELHPATAVLRAAGLEVDDGLLELAVRAATRAWTWERIRAQAAAGQWDTELVSPELAAWMDQGMFSRWVLAGTRSCDELLAAASASLRPATRRKIRDHLGPGHTAAAPDAGLAR